MVVEELLSGKITVGDLGRKYKLGGAGTIMRWVEWYRKEQEELVSLSDMKKTEEKPEEASPPDKDLKEELERAKAKIATLETMIDIAEKQLNIDIRKKCGTKPSLE